MFQLESLHQLGQLKYRDLYIMGSSWQIAYRKLLQYHTHTHTNHAHSTTQTHFRPSYWGQGVLAARPSKTSSHHPPWTPEHRAVKSWKCLCTRNPVWWELAWESDPCSLHWTVWGWDHASSAKNKCSL